MFFLYQINICLHLVNIQLWHYWNKYLLKFSTIFLSVYLHLTLLILCIAAITRELSQVSLCEFEETPVFISFLSI